MKKKLDEISIFEFGDNLNELNDFYKFPLPSQINKYDNKIKYHIKNNYI